jgi:hypothetical protein
VAGALIVAGGVYELSSVKLEYRRLMSAAWMGAIALVVLAQELLPPNRLIDVPLAVALVAIALI